MAFSVNIEAYKRVKQSLEATMIFSEEWKSRMLSEIMEAHREGYEKGIEKGIETGRQQASELIIRELSAKEEAK